MPLVSLGIDRVVTGEHGIVVSTPDTTVILHQGVRYAISGSIGETGIYADAANVRIIVMGSVSGVYGVRSTMPDLTLTIGSTGFVGGWFDAIGLSDTLNTIINDGTISGLWGMRGDGQLFLTNSGTILATSHAILSGGFDDEIVNSGQMTGAVWLGGGNDTLDNTGGRIIGVIDLQSGDDTLIGGDWAERVRDGSGRDDISLGGGNDILVVAGDRTVDWFEGGDGTDTLDLRAFGSVPASQIVVNVDLAAGSLRGALSGSDLLSGFERVLGSDGRDRIAGDALANTLMGMGGNDSISGAGGNDLIRTGEGANLADGGTGNDRLFGGDQRDTLRGGDGNDVIHGGYDTDLLSGGAGNDTFLFLDVGELFIVTGGPEFIDDFESGRDRIDLSQIDWNGTGIDNAFAFVGGAGISAPGQVAIRTTPSGVMWVDVSWMTAGTAASIRVGGETTLTEDDFIL